MWVDCLSCQDCSLFLSFTQFFLGLSVKVTPRPLYSSRIPRELFLDRKLQCSSIRFGCGPLSRYPETLSCLSRCFWAVPEHFCAVVRCTYQLRGVRWHLLECKDWGLPCRILPRSWLFNAIYLTVGGYNVVADGCFGHRKGAAVGKVSIACLSWIS